MKEMTPEGKESDMNNLIDFVQYVNEKQACFVKSILAEFWYIPGRNDTPTNEAFLSEYLNTRPKQESSQSPTPEAVAVAFKMWCDEQGFIKSVRTDRLDKYFQRHNRQLGTGLLIYRTTPDLFTLFTASPEYKELFK